MTDDDDIRIVPIDEAIRRIGEKEYVHTYTNPNDHLLIGFDYTRATMIKILRTHEVEDSGPGATQMGHTLCIRNYRGEHLFIEAAPTEKESA